LQERVVVDLKDKVGLASDFPILNYDVILPTRPFRGLMYELLVQDAAELLKGIDDKLSSEERIKLALKIKMKT